jgi:hypothetical protein
LLSFIKNKHSYESIRSKTKKMENHARVMVICLPAHKRDVCPRFSTRERATPIDQDPCFYLDSRSSHGDIFTNDTQAFLDLDL